VQRRGSFSQGGRAGNGFPHSILTGLGLIGIKTRATSARNIFSVEGSYIFHRAGGQARGDTKSGCPAPSTRARVG